VEVKNKKIFIETYGCQMNFSDSEIVASILTADGFDSTNNISDADFIFLNTCSIRENAEDRVRKRLQYLRSLKKKKPGLKIGLLGCMAERLKDELLKEENSIDIIAGPDSYRDLPELLQQVETGYQAINTILSADETYADIVPVRYDSNGVSAFISIMRGCENFCAYCVVPYVRGQERSRDMNSILSEATDLFNKGYREITLLGQNVNSYLFKKGTESTNFAKLLEQVAMIHPDLRVRFATSHPKDISDELLQTIASHENICRSLHLPLQSGSTAILSKMNRGYTREQYMEQIEAVRRIIPGCAISTDIITSFCDETEEDHRQTLSMMEWVGFDYAYMFRYSERPGTIAAALYKDNVPDEIKERRLNEIIASQQKLSYQSNIKDIGSIYEVMIEGYSKRSKDHFSGRNSQNKVVVFPKTNNKPGECIKIKILHVTSATLIGNAV
jgi:tRNA-2-methylthio-N6-dimethylallyladenosine synthase